MTAADTIPLRVDNKNLLDDPSNEAFVQEVIFTANAFGKKATKEAETAEIQKPVSVAPYPFWCSVRFMVITLLGFLGTMNLYALRVNLSIALPCMVFVNDTKDKSFGDKNVTTPTASSASVCIRSPPPNMTDPSNLPFVWTGEMRGLVNGIFYVGYVLFQVPKIYGIPSALLASRLGAKRVMLMFMSLCTLASLAQHPLAELLGRDAAHLAFIFLRFLNGVGSAAFLPVYTAILADWAPPHERSRMMGTAFAGGNLGTPLNAHEMSSGAVLPISNCIVLTFAAGGFLCKSLGWPALFYIPGGLSIIWLASWAVLVSDSPEKHRWISTAERDYILVSQGRSLRQSTFDGEPKSAGPIKKSLDARWRRALIFLRHLVSSPCVLALCAAHVACDYGDYTFLTNIPSFMDEVLYFNIEANGVLSAVPYLIYWGVISAVGFAVDNILDHKMLPLLLVRKAVTTIGLVGPAIVVCLLALTDCTQPVWAIIILSAAVSLVGFCVSGFYVNYMEVAGRYSGATFAFGNSIGSITGFVAPLLVGWITSNHTHAEWSVAFFVCAGVMAVGALVYLIFARADIQHWAREESVLVELVTPSSVSASAVNADGDVGARVHYCPPDSRRGDGEEE